MTRATLLRKRHRQNRWVRAQRLVVPLEAVLEQKVVAYVEKTLDGWALKVGKRGWPDRLILLGNGRHLWFEFKRRKFGSLTPAQRRVIPRLWKRGEPVHIVKTWEQALTLLGVQS